MALGNFCCEIEEGETAEIRFSCPECGARLLADAADAGGKADCPKCASSVSIPDHSSPPPHPPEKQYFLYKAGQQIGPLTASRMSEMISEGRLSRTDWAWTQGLADWQPLYTLPSVTLPPPPPAPPPSPAPGAAKSAPAPSPSTRMAADQIVPLFQRAEDPFNGEIDSLEVNDSWKEIFRLIEEAGGFNGLYVRNSRVLSFRERFTLMFNLWGFLLGPLYYFIRGMWVKGSMYAGLAVTLAVLKTLYDFHFAHYLIFPLPFLTANLANGDYYLWKVKKKQLW